jgi:hypothetical protein
MAVLAFDDVLRNQAQVFLTALGGQTIVYHKSAGGAARSIEAIVDHVTDKPAESGLGAPRLAGPRINVTVRNDGTYGISTADDGKLIGDSVQLPPRSGIAAKWCRILRIVSQDAGMVTLEVQ